MRDRPDMNTKIIETTEDLAMMLLLRSLAPLINTSVQREHLEDSARERLRELQLYNVIFRELPPLKITWERSDPIFGWDKP